MYKIGFRYATALHLGPFRLSPSPNHTYVAMHNINIIFHICRCYLQDKVETSEPVATGSAAAAVGRFPVRRVRRVWCPPSARGRRARPARAATQSVRASDGGRRGGDDCRSAGGRDVAVLSGCRVHRYAVPGRRGGHQRRSVELLDHGRGHRAKRVVRARVPYIIVAGRKMCTRDAIGNMMHGGHGHKVFYAYRVVTV